VINAFGFAFKTGCDTARMCLIESRRSLCKNSLKSCKNIASPIKAAAEGLTEPMRRRSRSNRGSGTNRRGGKITRRSKQTIRSTTYLHPPTRTRTGTAVGTKADTKMAKGRSRSSKTCLSEAAVRGFSVGYMGSTPNITHINAPRRSR
jgi:hypothetical protein